MDDKLVKKTEELIADHEQDRADTEAPNPENELSDEAAIQVIAELMEKPGMAELCGMIVINWQLYAVIRQEMQEVCGDKITPEVFSALLQGLNSTAMQPFNIQDLKRNVKKKLLRWVSRVSDERVSKNRRRVHGDSESSEDDT